MDRYTLCLIRHADHFLLVNRQKRPAMGMWNGVGGKIEPGETPEAAVIRETFEETGITLTSVTSKGIVRLHGEETSGMYLYLADLEDRPFPTPVMTVEGILDWKSLDWILGDDNMGVISNLRHYLPIVLSTEHPLLHDFHYDGHTITAYETHELIET
ncbi:MULTISPECIES: 8-oxo-dGTP diphosphatase [Exiguobacterium]|uniref:NUDIX hydrolase n=1 Tax=Exiguobacterium TaxID=33986 RepID=UPI0011F04249|nr:MULTISPECIES: 8-oxo-dGTP diphosphatase [Exiguobacterium]